MKVPFENKMNQLLSERHDAELLLSDTNYRSLRSDCDNCFGLCCVALYFSSIEGFPIDKEAGQPCINLQADFRCFVYKNLKEKGLKGCITFDCFGAGQKVAQVNFGGQDWRKSQNLAKQMFAVFLIMRQLHELLWYLTEALTLQETRSIHDDLSSMRDETEHLTHLRPDHLVQLDIATHRAKVNILLIKTSELVRTEVRRGANTHLKRKKTFGQRADLIAADLKKVDLKGANLRGACLIAADLRGNALIGTDLIGADFRDADIRGADLSQSIFLTQAQINAAKGDSSTKLPLSINRPTHWDVVE